MTTYISIKGKNERMGKFFKTPKHLLLHNGYPALDRTTLLMQRISTVIVCDHENTPGDTGIVDMLLKMHLPNKFFVIDCDVIPYKLNQPQGNTVYLFKNPIDSEPEMVKNSNGYLDLKFKYNIFSQYSNYKLFKGKILECNEKGEQFDFCGAGVYYFENANDFKLHATGCNSLAEVVSRMTKEGIVFKGDTTSNIFRFGTLTDIIS